MNEDKYDILMHTEFFNNEDINIMQINEISPTKLKVDTNKGSFVFGLYEMEDYGNIEKEEYLNAKLEEIGAKPLKIYEHGFMPDLDKSYKISEYRKEVSLKEFLSNNNAENNREIGFTFGKILKHLHDLEIHENIDRFNEFNTKCNYLFYIHGINDYIGDDDYILIDFINNNIHLTKNTAKNVIYSAISDKNIRVYEDKKIDLRALKENEIGDGIFDFVEINRIAVEHPEFSRGVIDSYFDNERPPIKFFRLLSLYEAYTILYNIVENRTENKADLNEKEIDDLMKMYDYFNQDIPTRIQN